MQKIHINRAYIASTHIYYQLHIPDVRQQLFSVTFVVVLVNYAESAASGIAGYNGSKTFNQGFINMGSVPLTLDIPDEFGHSSYGGFDGNCMFGLREIQINGNAASEIRTFYFSIDTNPITGIQKGIQGSEYFFVGFGVGCFMECPLGTYSNRTDCLACLSECQQCSDGASC